MTLGSPPPQTLPVCQTTSPLSDMLTRMPQNDVWVKISKEIIDPQTRQPSQSFPLHSVVQVCKPPRPVSCFVVRVSNWLLNAQFKVTHRRRVL